MYSEGSTNTRTLEGTLHETISRLTECKQTPQVARLVHQARRFLLILNSWEGAPPPPAEQNEIIDEIMRLLKSSMTIPLERINTPDRPLAAQQPAAAKAARDDEPEISIGDSSPPSSAPPSSGRRASAPPSSSRRSSAPPSSRRPHTRRREGTLPLGRVPVQKKFDHTRPAWGVSPSQPDEPGTASASASTVLRPYREPWTAVPGRMGLYVKMVHDDPRCSTCRALVRLEAGAQLPGHRHAVAEDIYVLAGSLQLGEQEAHAGEIVHHAAGSESEPIRSPGESTLLLIGSDRPELAAAQR